MEKSRTAQASFLCLFIIILSNAEDISIDCGSLVPLTDGDNRRWVGDRDYVTTGLTSKHASGEIDDALSTLRYFPTGDTNCYSNIPVEKGEKTLVRTRFNYGNYDGESNAPEFDVVYDGKYLDTVSTSKSKTNPTFSEAIFIPENGNISVCFVRTFLTEHPLVSTIEVRTLDKSMYSLLGSKEGFILHKRTAYGRRELVRSPFDPYDRFWVPANRLRPLTSSAISINTLGADNQPPEIVLRTSRSKKSMSFSDLKLSSGVTFYLVMYFSEPITLDSDQKRSFEVYYDGKQIGSDSIEPPFGAVTQISLRGVVATKSPYLQFKPTPDSNLDPLINALEFYLVTHSGDTRGRRGGGGGSGGGSRGNSDRGGSSGSEEDESDDSPEKQEEGKISSLALIVGISIPSLLLLGSVAFGLWYFIIKHKRNQETARPNKEEANVNVQVPK